jgi:heme-degrading monooxygenase HmoA
MFCRASHYQTRIEDLEQILQIFEEQMIPVMSRYEGYKGIEIMTIPTTGEFVVLKFWDSETNATAWSNSEDHKKFGPQITPLLIGNRTHYSYIVQTRVMQQN